MARKNQNETPLFSDEPEVEFHESDTDEVIRTLVDPDYEQAGYIENVDGIPVIPSGETFQGQSGAVDVNSGTPADLVHDESGHVREAFLAEGIGQVTTGDALNVLERAAASGRLRVVERPVSNDETVYDLYDVNDRALVFGAALRDIEAYL